MVKTRAKKMRLFLVNFGENDNSYDFFFQFGFAYCTRKDRSSQSPRLPGCFRIPSRRSPTDTTLLLGRNVCLSF